MESTYPKMVTNSESAGRERSYGDAQEQDVLQRCQYMLEGNKTASTPTYFGLLVRTGSLSQELNMPMGSSEDTKAVFLQQEPHHMELLWPNGSPRAYGNWRSHMEEFMATGRKNPTGLKLILGFTLVRWDLESRA